VPIKFLRDLKYIGYGLPTDRNTLLRSKYIIKKLIKNYIISLHATAFRSFMHKEKNTHSTKMNIEMESKRREETK